MIRARQAAALLLGLAATLHAFALNLGDASPSYDGVRYVFTYPNGDKPEPGCATPAGWTEAALGTGFGEACDDSGDFAMNGGGMNSTTSLLMLYQDAGSGDVQFCAEFEDPYEGASDPLASVGIGLREATTATGYLAQVHSAQNGSTVLEFKYGSTNPFTTVAGAAGQSRPRVGCITLDKSENEIRAFGCDSGPTNCTEIGRTNFTFSGNPYAWAFVQSKSTTQALQATIKDPTLGSTLTVYTPDPPPPGAPELVTPIPNQTGVQGEAFSLSCAANFSGATSYSVSGLAGSTGISFNTSSCAFSGTFNANDVGTRNITVTATNAGGSIDDQFSLVVTAPPASGSVFAIPDVADSTASTFDCSTTGGANGASWSSIRVSGSNTSPKAGDTLRIDAGTRGPTTFRNCNQGTASAPITVKNDANDSGQVVIRYAGSGGFALRCTTCINFVIEGVKYSGAPSALEGVTIAGGTRTETSNTAAYGILLTKTGSGQPTHYLRLDGLTSKITVKHIAIDAVSNSGGTGICFSLNDHQFPASENPGVWREDINFIENLGKFCGAEGEGFYVGPNQTNGDIPLRNVRLEGNLVLDSGRDGINIKSVYDGINYVINNSVYRPGETQGTSQNQGINIQAGATWTISGNKIVDAGGYCFVLNHQEDARATNAAQTALYENNISDGCGKNAGASGDVYRFTRAGTASPLSVTIRNVTMADFPDLPVRASGLTSCALVNSIVAKAGSNPSGCTNTNTRIQAENTLGFVGGGDYHITSGSPARDSGNTNCPSTDIDGESRPQQGACDQGADEFTP